VAQFCALPAFSFHRNFKFVVLAHALKPAFFLAPSGSAEAEPFQRTVFQNKL
jgi:hypothetical protein